MLIFASVVPLIKQASETLLLKCPTKVSREYGKIMGEIKGVQGIKQVIDLQVWQLAQGEYVANVRVES